MYKQTLKNTSTTDNKNEKSVHHSDGSELIPAKIQSDFSDQNSFWHYVRDDLHNTNKP